MMPRSRWGAKASVLRKVTIEIAPSYHWACQAWTKPLTLTRPITAIMITAARTRLWKVVEQRREEEQHDDDGEARDDAGHPGEGAGLEVDRAAREAPRGRVAPADRAADVGDPLTDQFLVGIDALAGLGGHGLGDGDRLHEAEEGDDHRRDDQPRDDPHVDVRQARGRQSTRDGADHRSTAHQQQVVGVERFVADLQPPAPVVGRRSLGNEIRPRRTPLGDHHRERGRTRARAARCAPSATCSLTSNACASSRPASWWSARRCSELAPASSTAAPRVKRSIARSV